MYFFCYKFTNSYCAKQTKCLLLASMGDLAFYLHTFTNLSRSVVIFKCFCCSKAVSKSRPIYNPVFLVYNAEN